MFHTPKEAPSSISSSHYSANPLFFGRSASFQKSRTHFLTNPTRCLKAGGRRPICLSDIQDRLFDPRSCAASPWRGHGLSDVQDGAKGADKAGKSPASGMVVGVNSGHRAVTRRIADGKRLLDLRKKGVYSLLTIALGTDLTVTTDKGVPSAGTFRWPQAQVNAR